MQKITFLISGFLLLFVGFLMIPFSVQASEINPNSSIVYKHSQKHHGRIIQDKNLIRGKWGMDDSAIELQVLELLKNGGLQVNYSNSKLVFIEKAGWTESSDVLRIFIIYRQDDKPGYSLSLNYIADKDLLVGIYTDALDNKSYNVTFRRIK